MRIRLTVRPDTWPRLSKEQPTRQQDSCYGTGSVIAHLIFSWQKALDDTGREFGHYEVLSPKRGVFAIMLEADAS